MSDWWQYDNLPSGEPYEWGGAARGEAPWDNLDFHLDLGCGTVKKGRLGIDRFYAPGVDLLIDLSTMRPTPVTAAPETLSEGERSARLETERLFSGRAREKPGAIAGLPFPDESIASIVSHHALEHIGEGFIPLMDECHRILKPGGVLRIIVPLFPSSSAVDDPDHVRYFTERSFEMFCGTANGEHWAESFSVPYTSCRFEKVDLDMTAMPEPHLLWTGEDAREVRVALRKWSN